MHKTRNEKNAVSSRIFQDQRTISFVLQIAPRVVNKVLGCARLQSKLLHLDMSMIPRVFGQGFQIFFRMTLYLSSPSQIAFLDMVTSSLKAYFDICLLPAYCLRIPLVKTFALRSVAFNLTCVWIRFFNDSNCSCATFPTRAREIASC